MNNKGFMMAEVIVVSSIVVVFLTSLYLSYNKLITVYKTRINYYDSTTLHRLAYYRDALVEEDKTGTVKMNLLLSAAKNRVIDIFDNNVTVINKLDENDRVYLIYTYQKRVPGNKLSSFGINSTFQDYMNFISTGIDVSKTNYILVAERCVTEDDCKYAYLEVYDGYET